MSNEIKENEKVQENEETLVDETSTSDSNCISAEELGLAEGLNFPDVFLPKFDRIVFPSNRRRVSLHLQNPAENDGKYNLSYRLCIKEKREEDKAEEVSDKDVTETAISEETEVDVPQEKLLFVSPSIAPCQDYKQTQINERLRSGEYDATMYVQVSSTDLSCSTIDVIPIDVVVVAKFKFPWWIPAVILAALLIGFGIWYFFVPKTFGDLAMLESIGLDPNLGKEAEDTSSNLPGFTVHGFSEMTIPANTTEINVNLENPKENKGYFNLTFKITLDKTGEVLYKSGLVPPGETLERITLKRGLSAGTYKATLFVQPYLIDDQSVELNNMTSPLTITVE